MNILRIQYFWISADGKQPKGIFRRISSGNSLGNGLFNAKRKGKNEHGRV
jgi:hypothetical protein